MEIFGDAEQKKKNEEIANAQDTLIDWGVEVSENCCSLDLVENSRACLEALANVLSANIGLIFTLLEAAFYSISFLTSCNITLLQY